MKLDCFGCHRHEWVKVTSFGLNFGTYVPLSVPFLCLQYVFQQEIAYIYVGHPYGVAMFDQTIYMAVSPSYISIILTYENELCMFPFSC